MATRRALAGAAAIVLIAVVAVIVLYRATLDYGFDYDDYHFVRPYSASEVASAFHGPWDPAGIEVPFFRPLTVAMFAARFETFGLNARAYHAASLGLFALAAVLAGLVTACLSRRWLAGVMATLFFAVHPAMPYALVAWITNQMHLAEILVVLSALLWWHAVRARAFVWWIPLWVFAIMAFLIKEDGVMLLPTILALHVLRRWTIERTLPRVPVLFLGGSTVLLAALLAGRSEALGGLGGYGRPSLARAWHNSLTGLDRVFRLVPPDRPWQPAASWFATILPFAGLLSWPRTSPGVRYATAAGIVIALFFNLPFIFVTKNEQMHIVALGAALVLAASACSVIDACRGWRLRGLAGVVLAAGVVAMSVVARDISTDFAPFGPIVRSHDNVVKDWAAVPSELREYLLAKLGPGASAATVAPNPVDAVETVLFNAHSYETSPSGVRYRWMAGPRIEIETSASAHELTIPLRHEIGAFRETAEARIEVDGRRLDQLSFRDGEWHYSRIPLRPATVSAARRMHRIILSIDHAWVPASLIPGSRDSRTLGLQLGVLRLQ